MADRRTNFTIILNSIFNIDKHLCMPWIKTETCELTGNEAIMHYNIYEL